MTSAVHAKNHVEKKNYACKETIFKSIISILLIYV